MSRVSSRRYLITSALPYANGPLHFGHITGVYLPADIYCRHRRLQGHDAVHISGSDEHGVAIMLAAEKSGISYQSHVDKWHQEHAQFFAAFGISHDFFGRTSAPYHAVETKAWFKALYDAGFIGKKTEKQLYCIDDRKFLPDRYVEGTCYVCGFASARGDECPNCGEWIDPIRLLNPVSKLSGSRNIEIREAEHYYFLDGFKVAYADLSNKVGILVHRALTFVQKNWPEGLEPDAFEGVGRAPRFKISTFGIARF